jgi:hypothetical protein
MDRRFLRNVLVKGLLLFAALNLLFAAGQPVSLGRLSAYNRLFPGRLRFPFGENPAQAYNLSLFDLEAMFAAHVIAAAPKPADEYRVILIGDSSTWGTLLRPEETLAGLLDAAGLTACDGRPVRVYNLGYPTISLAKDLMILAEAMRYAPDLVIWPLTLEAFPAEKQLASPIVSHNSERVRLLIQAYNLPFDVDDPALLQPSFWDGTLISQRRALADLARLQLYGVLWAATGVDQVYPSDYLRAQTDFEADLAFHDRQPPALEGAGLAFEVLAAGLRLAGETPVLIVNEPMLISAGKNSNLRYNFFYPRWAYDQYRQVMAQRSRLDGWNYLDTWDMIPAAEFTNSAIHMTPAGEALFAQRVAEALQEEFRILGCVGGAAAHTSQNPGSSIEPLR